MTRSIRYQGAIIQNDCILLIKHRIPGGGPSFWAIPGGGMEAGETEEVCVAREMYEETNLRVQVHELLLDEPDIPNGSYLRRKTYRCSVMSGNAQPGYEPAVESTAVYAITDVGWFDMREPQAWDTLLLSDAITYPSVQQIRQCLGYE